MSAHTDPAAPVSDRQVDGVGRVPAEIAEFIRDSFVAGHSPVFIRADLAELFGRRYREAELAWILVDLAEQGALPTELATPILERIVGDRNIII